MNSAVLIPDYAGDSSVAVGQSGCKSDLWITNCGLSIAMPVKYLVSLSFKASQLPGDIAASRLLRAKKAASIDVQYRRSAYQSSSVIAELQLGIQIK